MGPYPVAVGTRYIMRTAVPANAYLNGTTVQITKVLNDPEDIEKYGKNRYKAKALSGTQVGRTLFVQHILLEPELPLAPAAHPDSPE